MSTTIAAQPTVGIALSRAMLCSCDTIYDQAWGSTCPVCWSHFAVPLARFIQALDQLATAEPSR